MNPKELIFTAIKNKFSEVPIKALSLLFDLENNTEQILVRLKNDTIEKTELDFKHRVLIKNLFLNKLVKQRSKSKSEPSLLLVDIIINIETEEINIFLTDKDKTTQL